MVRQGKFVVVDGIDGVGKGVFLDTFIETAKEHGKRVFDVNKFWQNHDYHPNPSDIIGKYDIILTSEPTFVHTGRVIRNELIAKNNRSYSPQIVAQAYALDRMVLYENLLIPCLEAGVHVFQSRSFSTSIVYQRQSAIDLEQKFSVEEIMSIPGNTYCQKYPMDFLIVPTISNVKEAISRAEKRDKNDNCTFENLEFQIKIKEHYESQEFQNFFTNLGVQLIYLDAGKTLEFSQEQAREFYKKNIK